MQLLIHNLNIYFSISKKRYKVYVKRSIHIESYTIYKQMQYIRISRIQKKILVKLIRKAQIQKNNTPQIS